MPSCHFVYLILLSSGQKVPKSGPFKNEGIHEGTDHSQHGYAQVELFLYSFPKRYDLGNRSEYALANLNATRDHLHAPQKRPLLWRHGTSNNRRAPMQGGIASSAQQPPTLRLLVFAELTLIHPLIFRRRSFATVGTNFD
jgi:hypothetical protein